MKYSFKKISVLAILLVTSSLALAQEYRCVKINELDSSLSHYYVIFGLDIQTNKDLTVVLDKGSPYPLDEMLLQGILCDTLDTLMVLKDDVFSIDSTKITIVSEFKSVVTKSGKTVLNIKEHIYPLIPTTFLKAEFYKTKGTRYNYDNYRNNKRKEDN